MACLLKDYCQSCRQGVGIIIPGCTEIILPARKENSAVPLFDFTVIHIEAAVEKL